MSGPSGLRPSLPAQERDAAIRDIQSSDRSTIMAAAKLLSTDPSTASLLLELLKREVRADNRQGILYALTWHASLDTWTLMVRILGDSSEHPKVRGQAAEAISYMFLEQQPGTEAFDMAVKVLVEAAKDPSPEVRYCAANAMGCSGYLPLVSTLKAMLEDRVKVAGWVGTVADEAARALEWIVGMHEQRQRRGQGKQ